MVLLKKWIATEGEEADITIGLTYGRKIRKYEQKIINFKYCLHQGVTVN